MSLPSDGESVTRIFGPPKPRNLDVQRRLGVYEAPHRVRCLDCTSLYGITAAVPVGGIQCGVLYLLECRNGHEAQFFSGDSFEAVAYGSES